MDSVTPLADRYDPEQALRHEIRRWGLSIPEIAELLHVSQYTLQAWLKPSSPNRTPRWAPELLELKREAMRRF